MTEPLFHFVVLRPPVEADPTRSPISLSQESAFQKELKKAAQSSTPRASLEAVSRAFIASDQFISSPDGNDIQKKLVKFSTLVDKLEQVGASQLETIVNTTKNVFGEDPSVLVRDKEFVNLKQALKDSIVAIKYIQEAHSLPLAALVNELRNIEVIEKAASDAPSLSARDTPNESTNHESLTGDESPWMPEKDYDVGDRVRFQEIRYECIQAHRSRVNWEPQFTPELWKAIGAIEPELPEVDFPLYRKRTLLLPLELDLKSILATSTEEKNEEIDNQKVAADKAEIEAQALLAKHEDLSLAVNELVKMSPDHLQVTIPPDHGGADVDPKFTRNTVLGDQLQYRSSLRKVALTRSDLPTRTAEAGHTSGNSGILADEPTPTPTPVKTEPTGAFTLAKDLLSDTGVLGPLGLWKHVPADTRTPRLKEDALSELSERTRKVLSVYGINPSKQPINSIVIALRKKLNEALDGLQDLVPSGENVTYTRKGSAFIATRTPIISKATSLLYGYRTPRSATALPALPIDGRIPTTKGKVTPSGVADLLVVKQTLKSYQGADIAHVENVLKGETGQRTYKKTTRTEGMISTETETNKSEEHELSTTSRFEMSKEASNTIKDDQSLKGSLKVSAKYGPAVSVDASVEGSVSRSGEEVNKAASKYSQDVLDRTVKKISERVMQKEATTTLSEIVEDNQHGINNGNGTEHISGVYQWLNKVYEARVFNYGLRMMFDFMIPEPAAFLTYAIAEAANNAESDLLLEKPTPFTSKPADIRESNVGNLILKYQATDVLPPPDDYVTISDQAKFGDGDSNTNYSHGAIISIPSGYEAIWGTVSTVWRIWENKDVCIDVQVGSETHRFENNGEWSWPTNLINKCPGSDDVASGGSIPWAFNTVNASGGVISVEVLCRVTDRRKQQWQAETHARLMMAYKARMQDYDDRLARQKLQEGITIQGSNPTANLNTIKSELKKYSISILTAQHYDLFNSITRKTPGGRPEINLYEAEAEGFYVRFFEQAFEWDQIMYIAYPYFWGEKSSWVSKLTINDPDPVFDEFLKSGFARVVVPARPGFEGAIDHFMRFGVPWNGGPLPPITSGVYVPIADELAERLGKPEQEVPQGDPWDVTLPTKLVKLRSDDSLPIWKKEGNAWIPGN